MKIGPVTKLGKRNTATLTKINDDVVSTNGDVIIIFSYLWLIWSPLKAKNYKLIAADLSKEKVLNADPKATQKIVFTGTVKTKLRTYYILEQSK